MDGPGTLLAGKYQLVDIAGTGGMAAVWRAVQRGAASFERYVAVKLIRENLAYDPSFVAMFVEEARVSAQLVHPNVVQVYDFGQDGDRYFLVMEWVEGVSLSMLVRLAAEHGARIPWPFVTALGLEVLRGLGAAHERTDAHGRTSPIYHRDVTPQNILLGSNGTVKIADFGLARATDRARMTAPDIVKGKVGYLAPELTKNPEPNPRTDLYALGVVMWQALAGRRLFDGKDDIEIFRAATRGEIPPIGEIRQDVPGEVANVIERALAFDPSDRFGSALQMARVLGRALRTLDFEPTENHIAGPVREAMRILGRGPG